MENKASIITKVRLSSFKRCQYHFLIQYIQNFAIIFWFFLPYDVVYWRCFVILFIHFRNVSVVIFLPHWPLLLKDFISWDRIHAIEFVLYEIFSLSFKIWKNQHMYLVFAIRVKVDKTSFASKGRGLNSVRRPLKHSNTTSPISPYFLYLQKSIFLRFRLGKNIIQPEYLTRSFWV